MSKTVLIILFTIVYLSSSTFLSALAETRTIGITMFILIPVLPFINILIIRTKDKLTKDPSKHSYIPLKLAMNKPLFNKVENRIQDMEYKRKSGIQTSRRDTRHYTRLVSLRDRIRK